MDYSTNPNEQQHRVIKYIVEKLETYAQKSHIWRLFHSSHLHRHLLRRSGRVSKMYSISEDLVRQCINQLFNDVDQYVTQLHRLIYSSEYEDLIPFFNNTNENKNNAWYTMQLKRARNLFPNQQELNDNDLLTHYYTYIDEKLTPKHNLSNENEGIELLQSSFDLNSSYKQAESKAKEYLKNLIENFEKRRTPNLQMIDEMIKLGIGDMKKMPSEQDFEMNNHFLGRMLIFYEIKRAYKSILQNTSDDFMLLRFGKLFGQNEYENTQKMNKQFLYLLHLFLKSVAILFTLLKTNTNDNIISSISKIASLFFFDDDHSMHKLNIQLLSPEFHIDQWTWLLQKWKDILRTMPLMFIQAGAFSRLIRTTIGIGLMYLGKQSEILINNYDFINEQLFYSLQIGFYFGIAYSIVDCLQDEISNLDNIPLHHFLNFNLNQNEKLKPIEIIDKWLSIMEELLNGNKNNFNQNQLPKTPFTTMLIDSFDNLLLLMKLTNNTYESFNQLSLLLRSQRFDKKTIDEIYNNEQLYLGSLLKSHFTSTCTTYLVNMKTAREDNDRLWLIPFLGQLTDDCRDFNNDIKSKSITPFTYYALLKQQKQSNVNHLLNPFYTFLNLCSDIYQSSNLNNQTGAFLGRRISRSLYSIEITSNKISYLQFLHLFSSDNQDLYNYFSNKLYKQFHLITDPEKYFFRIIDNLSIKYSKTNRKLETYICENIMNIEDALIIRPLHSQEFIEEENILISAMNYSVKAGGKRLRPLLMLMVADLCQIELNRILPLTSGIEYLHTSSLIFDDLPAQDNSDLRRGQTSLHKTIINNDIPFNLCEGRAQLAAVDLIAISMNIINHGLIKNGFLPQCVNRVVGEISLLMHDLCIGQMMDLRAARTGFIQDNQQIEKLDQIAWFKTGKTIEVVMVMPIILNQLPSDQQTIQLSHVRQLSRIMGILFQMRDDLLDVEDNENIGKPKAIDIQNNTVTYVSLLGIQQTQQRLQIFLNQALQLVDQCWPQGSETIKDVIRYIVTRKH